MKFFAAAALATFAATGVLAAPAPAAAASPLVPGANFDRIMTVIFENTDYSDVIADPYFSSLTTNHNGKLLTNYMAIAHPSQPNYVGLLTGGKDVSSDSTANIAKKNLVDLLEAKNIDWRAYMENYPGNCFASDSSDGLYRRKHNPFISMNDVRTNAARCAKIVDAQQFTADVSAGTVPSYVFFTPNMNDDGHDTDLATASAWAQSFFEPLLSNADFMKNTLIVITWDESESYIGANKVAAYLLGPGVDTSAGTEDSSSYSHYSVLRTIEDNWSLGSLGRSDKTATPFSGVSRQA
ncbi:hypothetical protein HDU87_005106 [Geranomyces variabilis]|uniref:Acid phosphatase n=1 Tax=Geranomyces variabilis TaxID=109894 RepID=A0AAD5TVC9_9FUNG|nr:hypothetical protein HDU87_005106 [Geranomyces variabilis]